MKKKKIAVFPLNWQNKLYPYPRIFNIVQEIIKEIFFDMELTLIITSKAKVIYMEAYVNVTLI